VKYERKNDTGDHPPTT